MTLNYSEIGYYYLEGSHLCQYQYKHKKKAESDESQPAIICSKLITETLEHGVILISLLLTLNIFHTLL